jgi:hypothetical protein
MASITGRHLPLHPPSTGKNGDDGYVKATLARAATYTQPISDLNASRR